MFLLEMCPTPLNPCLLVAMRLNHGELPAPNFWWTPAEGSSGLSLYVFCLLKKALSQFCRCKLKAKPVSGTGCSVRPQSCKTEASLLRGLATAGCLVLLQ